MSCCIRPDMTGSKEINAFYVGTAFMVLTVFEALWAPSFLMHIYHMPYLEAMHIASYLILGMTVGMAFFGWMAARVWRYSRVASMGSAIAAGCLTILIWVPNHSSIGIIILLVGIGFFAASHVGSYAAAHYFAPAGSKSTCLGMTNMMLALQAPVLQYLVGYGIEHSIFNRLGHYSSAYTIADFKSGFAILVTVLLLGALLICFVPLRCRPE